MTECGAFFAPFTAGFSRSFLKGFFHSHQLSGLCRAGLVALCWVQCAAASDDLFVQMQLPKAGDHTLHILTPNVLEVVLVNSKQPNPAHVDSWDWVNEQGFALVASGAARY